MKINQFIRGVRLDRNKVEIFQVNKRAYQGGRQFIIATKSLILMAYSESFIYEIKKNIERVSYEESENYNITKDFLNNYKKMIHILTK